VTVSFEESPIIDCLELSSFLGDADASI
jgi:hypothetical protein